MLQGVSCDLLEAVNECQTLIRVFENKRNDPIVYNSLYNEAVELADQFEIPPLKPRTTGRQRNRANPAIADIRDYWRVTFPRPSSGRTKRSIGKFRGQVSCPATDSTQS